MRKLSTLLSIAIILFFVGYVINNKSTFESLLDVPPLLIVVLLGLNVARIFNNGSFIKYTLEFFDKKISYLEGFYVSLLTYIGNLFGPAVGGAGVRAVYLKKKHNFSYTDFTSTLSGFYFINFIVNSTIGLLALVAIQAQTGKYSLILYLVLFGWLISSLYFASVRSLNGFESWITKSISRLQKLIRYLNNSVKGWRAIRSDKALLFRLVRVTLYGFLILFAIVWVEFQAVEVNVSLASAALYIALSALSLIINITPNAIGVREALFIVTSPLIGLSSDEIIAIAVIDRAANFVVIFAGYLIFKYLKAE